MDSLVAIDADHAIKMMYMHIGDLVKMISIIDVNAMNFHRYILQAETK